MTFSLPSWKMPRPSEMITSSWESAAPLLVLDMVYFKISVNSYISYSQNTIASQIKE